MNANSNFQPKECIIYHINNDTRRLIQYDSSYVNVQTTHEETSLHKLQCINVNESDWLIKLECIFPRCAA